MYVVVAYDIVSDRRRYRLSKTLSAFGERVNYSVFECEVRRRQFEGLQLDVERTIDPAEDSVRYYELCLDCRKRIRVSGKSVLLTGEPVVFV